MTSAYSSSGVRLAATLALLLAVAPLANAEDLPRVAVHPLVVVGASAEEARPFRELFRQEVARLELELPPEGERDAWLASLPEGRCVDEACLSRMAVALEADRALLVTVAPFAPELVFTARVVSPTGSSSVGIKGRRYPRDPEGTLEDDVRFALRQLLAELDLDGTALAPLITADPPPLRDAPMTARQRWALGLGITGAASTLVGVAFQLAAVTTAASLAVPGGTLSPSGRADYQTGLDQLRTQQGVAGAAFLVAGASLGGALWLTLSPPPAAPGLGVLTPRDPEQRAPSGLMLTVGFALP